MDNKRKEDGEHVEDPEREDEDGGKQAKESLLRRTLKYLTMDRSEEVSEEKKEVVEMPEVEVKDEEAKCQTEGERHTMRKREATWIRSKYDMVRRRRRTPCVRSLVREKRQCRMRQGSDHEMDRSSEEER